MNYLQTIFIQNVSHKLGAPLAVILGYAELLRYGQLGGLGPEQWEAISVIANRADELQTLLGRITTLLAIDGKEGHSRPLSLVDIVTAVIEVRRTQAQQAGLTLKSQPVSTLPSLTGDPGQLQQAIDCLVENAINFTPSGGRIEIKVQVQASWLYLTVTDTGIGITRDKLVDIFDAFSQINGSSHRHCGGLGLGLTLVKAVVEAHGGQITVKSQPDFGSQFTIKLPVLSSTAEDNWPIKNFPTQKRILIVDDEENVVSMLQTGLEQLSNCEIVRATDGQQALRLFKQHSFDLLITDYNMPGMDGLTLAAQIRRLRPQTIVIMLTGYANDKLRRQANHVSITRILDKPVRLKEIRRLASELLGQAK